MKHWRITGASAMLALAAVLAGCGGDSEKLPATYKVDGTVLRKNGSPYAGGMINFRHATTDNSANGMIKADGTFSLETMLRSGKRAPGAEAGEYTVMIMPPGDSQDAAKPIILKKIAIEAKDNNLTIKLDQ